MQFKKKKNLFEKGDFLPFLLILPVSIVVLLVMIFPLVYGLIISLFDYRMGDINFVRDFIGIDNYIRMVSDKIFWKSTFNTLCFTVGAIIGDLLLGTLIALWIQSLSAKLRALVRPIVTIPLLVSPVIIGLIWKYMFNVNGGIVYWILSFFGVGVEEFAGLSGSSTAMLCVIIAHWWQVIPFVIIVLSAGLVSIPTDYYEAADIDGASVVQKFFKISLPSLIPQYMVILLFNGVDAVKVFDIIYALTGGGPNNATMSLSLYAYKTGFNNMDMGYAMAISNVTMIISFLLFGVIFIHYNSKLRKKGGRE